jgi:DnaK suppressor protein
MDEARAKALLLAERDEVRNLLNEAEKALREDREDQVSDIPRDGGDAAQPLGAEITDQDVRERLRERLDVIERALRRLDDGTYGRSVRSGVPIPDQRLEADPAAELTVEEARAAGSR